MHGPLSPQIENEVGYVVSDQGKQMMADDIPLSKRGKLPPLGSDPNDTTPRNGRTTAKKRKPKQEGEDGEVKPSPRPKSRSTSRAREASSDRPPSREMPHPPQQSDTPRVRKPKAKKEDQNTDDDALESPSEPPQRPKRKKPRASQPRSQSKEVLIADTNGDAVSPHSASSVGKKKKKKKKAAGSVEAEVIGLEAELSGIDDDVVVTDETLSMDETKWTVPTMRSEPINKVFIEQKSGFKTADKNKIAKKRAEELQRAMDLPQEAPSMTTIQFALSTQKIFKVISVFFNGLFAGMTLWHIVASFMLLNEGDTHFLENYHRLAQPVQCVFYFLFAVCAVATFDRYDVGRIDKRFLQRAFTLQSGAIASLFYVAGMVFSLAMAADDNRIALYMDDQNLWDDPEDTSSRLRMWKILNTVRGVFAMLAWLVISLRPSTDRLTKNLEKADENIIEPQYTSTTPEIQIIR